MPIHVRCADCAAQYNLGDQLAGTKIRCKKCASVIAVPDAEEEATTAAPPKRTETPAATARAHAVRADDDDVPPPRRKSLRKRDSKSPLAWIIGSSVVLLLVIAGLVYYFVAGRSLRGEQQIKEMIKARQDADAELDPAKKFDAMARVAALTKELEKLQLTEVEQKKLTEKYGRQLNELGMGMDDFWAAQEKARKNPETENTPKNDVDSLLAELQATSRTYGSGATRNVVKRITDNIPADSARRSEVFGRCDRSVAVTPRPTRL